ncbi:MAG: DUF3105 domain-containing protein [Chloroflexi bacterium]|nr:DUF3105 domain-containing protein [Chloroflexota bacterium]
MTEKNPEEEQQATEEEFAPEASVPEADQPAVDAPEATAAEETDAPEASAPEADEPVADAPDATAIEETAALEADAPEPDEPVANAPGATATEETAAPEANAPEPDEPVADAPEAIATEDEPAPEASAPEPDKPVADAPEAIATEAAATEQADENPVVAAAVVEAEDDDEPDFDRDGQTETPPKAPRVPRIREPAPSRRTIQREQRRRRSTARRARKRTIYGILGGLVAATLILGIALPSFAGLMTHSQNGADATGDTPRVGTAVAVQPSSVLEDGTSYTAYPSDPPTSGPSYAAGVDWGIYTEQQANEAVVRNLEQGAIVVNHSLTDEAQLADLTSYLEAQLGYPGCFIAQPYASVAEGSVTLTSWGWTETYPGVDRPGMQRFVDDHRNNGVSFEGQTCGADTTLPEAGTLDHSGN